MRQVIYGDSAFLPRLDSLRCMAENVEGALAAYGSGRTMKKVCGAQLVQFMQPMHLQAPANANSVGKF